MSYSNWGSHLHHHSKIELAAYVPVTMIVETLESCLHETFSTMEGREAIRKYLKMPIIKVSKGTRFPEPGIYININDRRVYAYLHRLYQALDMGEDLQQHRWEERKQCYYDNLLSLRQFVMGESPIVELAKGLVDPFFDRAHFEQQYKLQWKP